MFGALVLVLEARTVIGHLPDYDELLHVLAARSILESGEPIIADGVYDRARLFTSAVAASFWLLGESLVAARVTALVAACLLIVLLSCWVTRRAGVLAGAATAACLCLVPTTVEMAVFARFYTAHALLILCLVVSAYESLTPGRSTRARSVLVAFCLVLVALAWHLQESTAIAAGACLAGCTAVLLHDHAAPARNLLLRHPISVPLGGLIVAACALWLIWAMGLFDRFLEAPLWAEKKVGRYQYYFIELTRDLPLLWPLLPVAVVLTFWSQRRLAILCTVFVAVAFVLHSVAAQKAPRYLYYAVPFMCVLWGCALSFVIQVARRALHTRWPFAWISSGVIAALLAMVLLSSREGQLALKLVAGSKASAQTLAFATEPDWGAALQDLRRLARQADRIITSNAMKAVYYLGDYDYELNASIVEETDTMEEFGIDARTGRQAIGRPESVRHVLDMPGRTLIILEQDKIDNPRGVSPAVMRVIEASCTSVPLTSGARIHAWFCREATAH
jgi:hypothetical protein